MHPHLLNIIVCPSCSGSLRSEENSISCSNCGETIPMHHYGMPLLNDIPDDIVPSITSKRKPGEGTYWRRQNWSFLKRISCEDISSEQVVLEIGAGPGYFKSLFKDQIYLSTDFYPFENLDFVCNVVGHLPIRPESVDAVILANVLEHISESDRFLRNIFPSLKPGGLMLVTVPFMIKIHQAPYDFVRYTHFGLKKLLINPVNKYLKFYQ